MIWATVSSRSCFCWLYRASPFLAAKNINNLILVLTIWWCPCVESSLCCWKKVFAMTSVFSWQNSVNLCPASFCTPRSSLPVTPGIFWLPTCAFYSPMMKTMSFFFLVLLLGGLVGLHRSFNFSFFSMSGLGIDLDYCDIEWLALEKNQDHSVIFEITPNYSISDSSVDYEGYTISSKGF